VRGFDAEFEGEVGEHELAISRQPSGKAFSASGWRPTRWNLA